MDNMGAPGDASVVAALDRFLGLDCEPERASKGANPELLAFLQTKRYAQEMNEKVSEMMQAWEVEFRVCNMEEERARSTGNSIARPAATKLQIGAEFDNIEEIPLGNSSNSDCFAPFHTKVDNFLDSDDSEEFIPSSYIPSGLNTSAVACPAEDAAQLEEALWRHEDTAVGDSCIDELESPDVSSARNPEVDDQQEDSMTLDWIAEMLGNHQSRVARMGLAGLLEKAYVAVHEPPDFDTSVTEFIES